MRQAGLFQHITELAGQAWQAASVHQVSEGLSIMARTAHTAPAECQSKALDKATDT